MSSPVPVRTETSKMEAGPSEVRQKRHRRRRQRRQSEEVILNINDWGSELVASSSTSQTPALASGTEAARLILDTELQPPTEVPGTFFHSSSDVKVSGGNFTSSRHHQNNFIINITPPRAQSNSGRGMSSEGGTGMKDGMPRQTQTHLSLNIPSSRSTPKNPDLYYSHLACKGRGSPLWIPEPSENLPIEYQQRGIGIGDVGILTDSGSFDFLFNICTPADDPVNPNEMPEGFYPLSKPDPRDINVHQEFKSDSYLASGIVMTTSNEDSSELIFEPAASDGAILTMPNGSRSRDLVWVASFRKYAYVNAERWYKYANEVRGREVRNGDLRLVLGHNSSNAWGMATFANRPTGENSSGEERAFQLKFKTVKDGDLGERHRWACTGAAEVKAGPDRIEIDRLRVGEGSGENTGLGFENQCLFVRTMNITLQDDLWSKLSKEWVGLYSDDGSWSSSSQLQDSSPSPTHRGASSRDNTLLNFPAHGSTSGGGAARDSATDSGTLHGVDSPLPSTPQHYRNTAQLFNPPTLLDYHPSNAINKILLQERPHAKMAITIDQDWISASRKDDQGYPDPMTIWARLKKTHFICEGEDAVFLLPKNGIDNTGLLRSPHHTTSHVSQAAPYIGQDGVIDTRRFDWWDSGGIPEPHLITPIHMPSPNIKGLESELYSKKPDRPISPRPITRIGGQPAPVTGRMAVRNLFSTSKPVPNPAQSLFHYRKLSNRRLDSESLAQTTSATVHDPDEEALDPKVLKQLYDQLLDRPLFESDT